MKAGQETFDVVTQPWIPVRSSDGSIKEMGIRDVLRNAAELDEITHESVMVEYSLHRLLITLLLDALRPASPGNLEDMLSDGSFDMQAIDQYISSCREEGVTFDLFDPERPFLQVPYQAAFEKAKGPVGALDYSLPKGNNHVHFVHQDKQPKEMTFAQAAQLLPTLQVFCTIGGRGYASGINGPPPYYALIRGSNLFETLLFSMPSEEAFHKLTYDHPAVYWRTDGPLDAQNPVSSTSILGGMLFPARSVHLFAENGKCTHAYIAPGLKFKTDTKNPTWTDPHVAYATSDKGRFAWSPQKSRGVWRNIAQLAYPENMPAIVNQFKSMAEAGTFIHLQLYGVQTHQASFLHSMREDVRLPTELTVNEYAADTAVEMVKNAEYAAYRLRKSLEASGRAASKPILGDGLRTECVQRFYDSCADEFWIRITQMSGMEPDEMRSVLLEWATWIADQAKRIRRELYQSVQVGVEDLFALEEAGNKFAAYLGGMIKKNREGGK